MEHGGRVDATDAVERGMTASDETVRLRDKHVARTGVLVMIPGALVFLFAAVAVALGAEPAAPRVAALVPLLAFAGLVYTALANMVVRTAVTDQAVRVQWGLRRMDIPLAAITRAVAHARSGGPTAATGAGWSIFADRGAVYLRWTAGSETRSALIPAHDPAALTAAIEAARAGATGVRIAAAESPTEAASGQEPAAAAGARARR